MKALIDKFEKATDLTKHSEIVTYKLRRNNSTHRSLFRSVPHNNGIYLRAAVFSNDSFTGPTLSKNHDCLKIRVYAKVKSPAQ